MEIYAFAFSNNGNYDISLINISNCERGREGVRERERERKTEEGGGSQKTVNERMKGSKCERKKIMRKADLDNSIEFTS